MVLEHMLRIGRHAVVSFPNFGHWRIRLLLLFGGRMPQTDNLPDTWYDTPEHHFCTIKDFRDLCLTVGAKTLGAGARRLGPPAAAQRAVVVLEPVASWRSC
jgi:methionine biosynthesis protein MetW